MSTCQKLFILTIFNFTDIELHSAQAQKIATNILKNHTKLLGQNEAHTLNNLL
jgi:hypothetical protein